MEPLHDDHSAGLRCMAEMVDAAARIMGGDHSQEAHVQLRAHIARLETSRLKVGAAHGKRVR